MNEPLDIFGRPLADRRLLICVGPCCDRDGRASAQLAALRQLLIAQRMDCESRGVASCVRRHCLGNCGGEPLALTQPDNVWRRELTPDRLLRIFERLARQSAPSVRTADARSSDAHP